jgi:hypothetical protein
MDISSLFAGAGFGGIAIAAQATHSDANAFQDSFIVLVSRPATSGTL